MEGHCSTGQSPQWAAVPMEQEEGSSTTFLPYIVNTSVMFSPKIPLAVWMQVMFDVYIRFLGGPR